VAFDDEAFAITSAISKPAAVPMYNGVRATEAKTRSKQALTVGEGSDELFWGTPKQCKKKSGRESFFGRRAAGGRTGGPRSKIQLLFLHLAGTGRV
jgi:asparagine synthetase B (glutamine-hydrolysing)